MLVNFSCPSCGTVLQAGEELLGKQVRCGQCGQVFVAEAGPLPETQVRAPARPYPDHSGKAVASLVLGIVGLVAWCLPIFGLPVTIIGLVMGIQGRKSSNASLAIAGIVLSSIGLALSVLNGAWGAYLGAIGKHPLLK